MHPYHRNAALLEFCATRGIHVTAYAPLGSPDSASIFPRKKPLVLLQDETVQVGRWAAGAGASLWHGRAEWRAAAGAILPGADCRGPPCLRAARTDSRGPHAPWLCTPQAVAARLGRNAGQVLIRWALQNGTSVIPKSTSPARIQ